MGSAACRAPEAPASLGEVAGLRGAWGSGRGQWPQVLSKGISRGSILTEAGDRWAPGANSLSSFLVDRYSGITGQLREEAGPCPDRR